MTSVTGRLGDLGFSQSLMGSATSTGSSLQALEARISSGRSALSYSDLQGDTARYIASKNQLTEVQEYTRSTQTVGRYLTAADNALSSLSDIASNARAMLVRALGLDSPGVDQYQLKNQAKSLLDQAISSLNTQSEGSYIFAGATSDRAPVGFGSLTHLSPGPTQATDSTVSLTVGPKATPLVVTVPAGTSPAQAIKTALQEQGVPGLGRMSVTADGNLEVAAADGVSPFSVTVTGTTGGMIATSDTRNVRDTPPDSDTENFNYYQGLQGAAPRSAPIGAGTSISYGVSADEPAVERLLRALRVAETAQTQPTMDRAAVQKALGLMNDAISGISELRAHVGAQGKAVDDANSSNQLATVYVQNMVDETENLDLGTAMTSLSQQQLQLQAAYMILSRLSSLSLLNYLK